MRATKTKQSPTITRYIKDQQTGLYTLETGNNKYLVDRFRVEKPFKGYLQCKYVLVNDNGSIVTGIRPVGIKGIFRGDILRLTKSRKYRNSFLILIVDKTESSTSITTLFYLNKKPRNPQKFARIEAREYLNGCYD